MYKKKYVKYRSKFMKAGGMDDAPSNSLFRFKKIDWYLFFDLLQVSIDILNYTRTDDIIILIGDTPSYLMPFFKAKRSTHFMAFSNKPFGSFISPYGFHSPNVDYIFTPSYEDLNTYFNYLDNKTILTRKFIKDNWTKIVLVDSSAGSSIHGASIFFNRYISNINQVDDVVITSNIAGAKPLRFISLTESNQIAFNLDPYYVKVNYAEDNDNYVTNYLPNLIIYVGNTLFYHRSDFMMRIVYPRIVPFYSIRSWDQPLDKYISPSYDEAVANLKKLDTMLDIYSQIKSNNITMTPDNIFEFMATLRPKYSTNNLDKLGLYFNRLNLKVLRKKRADYFGGLSNIK